MAIEKKSQKLELPLNEGALPVRVFFKLAVSVTHLTLHNNHKVWDHKFHKNDTFKKIHIPQSCP